MELGALGGVGTGMSRSLGAELIQCVRLPLSSHRETVYSAWLIQRVCLPAMSHRQAVYSA